MNPITAATTAMCIHTETFRKCNDNDKELWVDDKIEFKIFATNNIMYNYC